MNPTCYYFPLEAVSSRYTHQLCNEETGWMTAALRAQPWHEFVYLRPECVTPSDIKVGAVLDAVGRSVYSMAQVSRFLYMVQEGKVRDGDVLYFQDFWTPGIEAILYTLHLYGIKVRMYSMLHAQSVDPWDFTNSMKWWIRSIERGYASMMDGIFVASSVHAEELENMGIESKRIHIVGLPFSTDQMNADYCNLHGTIKDKLVVFSSRLDLEKQPDFMVSVAKRFLSDNPDWKWAVTTSSPTLRSYNNPEGIAAIRELSQKEPRFIVMEGLSKSTYYCTLARASIHFNCSLQDYVSWTLIESQYFRCDPVFPNFRSFPECLKGYPLYRPWDIEDALLHCNAAVTDPYYVADLPVRMNAGRLLAAEIAFKGTTVNRNIWKDNIYK